MTCSRFVRMAFAISQLVFEILKIRRDLDIMRAGSQTSFHGQRMQKRAEVLVRGINIGETDVAKGVAPVTAYQSVPRWIVAATAPVGDGFLV